jgi:hypothetical protein
MRRQFAVAATFALLALCLRTVTSQPEICRGKIPGPWTGLNGDNSRAFGARDMMCKPQPDVPPMLADEMWIDWNRTAGPTAISVKILFGEGWKYALGYANVTTNSTGLEF